MPFFDPAFWNQPIDLVLFTLLVWFGWIPIVVVLFWGFTQMWLNSRQGLFNAGLHHVLLAIDIPALTEQSPKALENLFTNIAGAYSSPTWKEKWVLGKFQPSFSFEIASTDGYIQFYVHTQTKYRDTIEAGIYAQYPDAEINEVEDYTAVTPSTYPNETHEMWGGEMTLKKPSYLPIRTFVDFEDKMTQELKDPLGYILEQLGKMRPGESYWIQIVTQVRDNDWKEEGIKHINKLYGIEKPHKPGLIESGIAAALVLPSGMLEQTVGISLTDFLSGGHSAAEQDVWKAFKLSPTEIEQAKAILAKISKVGFNVKIRIVYSARKEAYSKGTRVSFVKGMFNQYAHLNLNAIGLYGSSIPKDDYFWQKWSYTSRQTRLMKAYQQRSFGTGANPMVLNSEELATLWHFPPITIRAPLIKKAEARRGEPPVGLPMAYGDGELPSGPPKPPVGAMAAKASPPPELPHGMPPAFELPAGAAHVPELPHPTAPVAPSVANVHEEEREDGLDATGMGPPADVVLPGPPPGYVPEQDEPPTNLPV